jgi:hypothetical protein
MSAAGFALPILGLAARGESNGAASLFDGKSLDGWTQIENSWTSFGSSDLTDLSSLAKKIADKSDPVAAYLNGQLDDQLKSELASYSPSEAPAEMKSLASAFVKALTKLISTGSLYDSGVFRGVALRPETQQMLKQNPRGADLARLNRMLLEDAFPAELAKAPATGWIVRDGAMASTGAGRGVIYTAKDFGRFRMTFTMRHVSGNPDHQACVLIFCARPLAEGLPLDALGGVQFQVPKGGHWDYRPGQNNAGNEEFTNPAKPAFDPHEWSRVELLAEASTGIARMAVAQPVGSKAVEILDFKNPDAGRAGPVALQMHNGGLFDEYKEIAIEENPKVFELFTVG